MHEEREGPGWVVVTADRVVRQRSKGCARSGALRDHLKFMGPVRRAQRCSGEGMPSAPVVFVEVTEEPRIPGQDVWPVVPSTMWQPQQAATMCAALRGQLRGHAAALPRASTALLSNN